MVCVRKRKDAVSFLIKAIPNLAQWIPTSTGAKHSVAGGLRRAHLLPGEVHRTENTDDDQADDDGGDGHPFGIPPQPPGSFIVSVVVAVLRLGDTKEESVTGKTGAFSGCLDETTLRKPLVTVPLSVRLLRKQHSSHLPGSLPKALTRPPED